MGGRRGADACGNGGEPVRREDGAAESLRLYVVYRPDALHTGEYARYGGTRTVARYTLYGCDARRQGRNVRCQRERFSTGLSRAAIPVVDSV